MAELINQLPDQFRDGLRLWVEDGVKPGAFLCAVLRNDLQLAVTLADDHVTLSDVRNVLRFLCTYAPRECSGDSKRFINWPAECAKQRLAGRRWSIYLGAWTSCA